MCVQSQRMSVVELWLVSLCVWAMQIACSSTVVSLSGWNSGIEIVVSVYDVMVSGSAENLEFNGSSKQLVFALSGRFDGLQWRAQSIWKHASSASYSLYSNGHPPQRRCCVSTMFFCLAQLELSKNCFYLCCLLLLCISLARDSSNSGLVSVLLYMPWCLSSLLFSIVHTLVPFGLCRIVCVCFVGCCMSSQCKVSWI